MSDSISRQQAIDAMCSACGHDCDKSEFVYNAPQDEQVIMCPEHYALSTLPSVQPEIIRCKDCKFYTPMNRETRTGICRLLMHQNFGDDWYCAGAERRTHE